MTRKWNTTKWNFNHAGNVHYSEVIMSAMASQITGVLIVCLNVCSVADRRKHQSSMSLAFVRGIHRWQVNSPHKGPVTRKMFPFDDVIMEWKSFGEMGPRTLRQPNLRKVRRPTVPWKGRNESPLIDIHSSIKAIHQSVIDIMDIHNSNMDVYITQSCISIIQLRISRLAEIVMDIHDLIVDVNNYIMAIHNCCELYP